MGVEIANFYLIQKINSLDHFECAISYTNSFEKSIKSDKDSIENIEEAELFCIA